MESTPKLRKDGERRREALLDAALRCFDRHGVLGVGIEDIRREAGASPSSVYHQFENLEAIMLALLVRIFTDLFAHLAARAERTRTAQGLVTAIVDGHIEWIAAHPVEGRFMYQAMTLEVGALRKDTRGSLAAEKQRLLAPVLQRVAHYVARGDLPPWPPALLEVVLLGSAHEALRRWLAGARELEPLVLRRTLPALAWKSIRRKASRAGVEST